MSKYEALVLKILDDQIKSTNQILEEAEKIGNKVINWHVIYRILMDLVAQKKAERVDPKSWLLLEEEIVIFFLYVSEANTQAHLI